MRDKVYIKSLHKGEEFIFNDTVYTVKQKYSDWKKDGEPYLKTTRGEIFYHDELEVEIGNESFKYKTK